MRSTNTIIKTRKSEPISHKHYQPIPQIHTYEPGTLNSLTTLSRAQRKFKKKGTTPLRTPDLHLGGKKLVALRCQQWSYVLRAWGVLGRERGCIHTTGPFCSFFSARCRSTEAQYVAWDAGQAFWLGGQYLVKSHRCITRISRYGLLGLQEKNE
jgi:hypothetical protein